MKSLILLFSALALVGCAAPVKHAVPSVAAVSGNIHVAHVHSANIKQGVKGIKSNNAAAVTNIDEAIKLLDTIQ